MSVSAAACRTLVVAGAAAAALASASSNQSRPAPPAASAAHAAPASQPMDPARALGLWKSSFGPVKIEPHEEAGAGQVSGIWVYDRDGQEIIGYFAGPLDGNVLTFSWHEPGQPADLTGEGYLVFDPAGRTFTGRWWTAAGDRGGEWQGWRQGEGGPEPGAPDAEPPPRDDGMPRAPDGPAEQAPPGGPPPDHGGEPHPDETI